MGLRFAFAIVLVLSGVLFTACGSDIDEQGSTIEPARTVEVTRTVTVVRTLEAEGPAAPGTGTPGVGAVTRESLPGPAVPQADDTLDLGETAELESGGRLTVLSGEAEVPEDEAAYRPGRGMEFFVIDVEACVPESADEPVFFSPREFGLLGSDEVRRIATVPARMPALRGARISPGNCNQGYVTFQTEAGAEPGSVIFEGSSVARWNLDSG